MQGSSILRISLGCLWVAALAAGQNNYVDDYEFDAPPPRQAHRPAPASFSRPASSANPAPRPTPVAILKQIDRHNEDGSYTYGYEGADGSFKIETKLVTGEVMGKYGYVDDAGKVRVVEYGANRYGFMPAGEGITVAPPTLVDETATKKGQKPGEVFVDDGQYYPEEENLPPPPPPRPAPRPAQRARPQPRPQQPQPLPHFEEEYVPAAPRRPPPSSSGPAPPRLAVPGAAPAPVFSPAPVYEEQQQQQHRSFSAAQRPPQPQRSFSLPQPQFDSRPQPRFEAGPAPVAQRVHQAPPQQVARFEAGPAQRVHQAPPQQVHRAQYARTSSGILDQLERDYALPQGSAATHDISFSSF